MCGPDEAGIFGLGIAPDQIEKLCRFLRSWRRQTFGRRDRCKRHHLRFEVLIGFTPTELVAAITLAEMGRGKVSMPFESAFELTRESLEARDLVNVIYEYGPLERFIPDGVAIAQGADEQMAA